MLQMREDWSFPEPYLLVGGNFLIKSCAAKIDVVRVTWLPEHFGELGEILQDIKLKPWKLQLLSYRKNSRSKLPELNPRIDIIPAPAVQCSSSTYCI